MLSAIVFDFDGVLVDSEPLHYRAFHTVAQQFGIEFSYQEYLERYVGYDDRDGFKAIVSVAGLSRLAKDQALIAKLCEEKAVAFEEAVDIKIELIPGIEGFVRHVRTHVPLAIASGATRRDIELVLKKLQWMTWFDPIVTADDVVRSKPDPQTYRLAVDRLAKKYSQTMIRPDCCLAIEDTLAGLESARGAGLKTLALDTNRQCQRKGVADRVVQSIEGVTINTLKEWFK
jgi:beta-phosphoglucomutase